MTGETAWQRSDVPARSAVFGDGERLYVVGRGADGKATGTRLSARRDGVPVAAPDFAAAYDQRVRIAGGDVLVAEKPAGGLVLRLYDVAAGKDVWSQKFAAGSVVMRSHDPDLAGVIEPEGRATVVSLRQRKVVFGGIVNVEHMKNVKEVHLLADGEYVYFAFHTKDPKEEVLVESNLQPFSGLRGIMVNGWVYAFDRHTGKIRWVNEIRGEELVFERGEDRQILLFTSRSSQAMMWKGSGSGPPSPWSAMTKRSASCSSSSRPRGSRRSTRAPTAQIYDINYDPAAGKIELLANTYKLTITRAPEHA